MFLRISAVAAAVLLAGCVSNNAGVETSTQTVPDVDEKVNTAGSAKYRTAGSAKHPTNAENIAQRLWDMGLLATAEPAPPDASELEDLWQRMQFQLTFKVPQTRPIVEQRNFYSGNQAYLDRVAGRAQPFLYYIVQEIEKRNMPLELALLPIVESAFDPFAHSPSAASGMWQFMPATGKLFGLKQNFWYDGRRDVVASTKAALDYLQYLHDKLEGDWLNAIAAYNSGEGRILSAIKKNKNKRLPTDFWSLDLPAETTSYVPKLLALVDILKRPDEFDIVWKFIPNEPKIELVDIGGQIDLAIAAEMAGINLSQLQALNPGFNQWATDPQGPHYLLLPKRRVQAFRQQLAKTPSQNWLHWHRYTVSAGDTLGEIAHKHGTDIGAIKRINRLNTNIIRQGQHLLIPVAAEDGSIFDIGTDSAMASASAQNHSTAKKLTYAVQQGDTLWDISREHKVTVEQLVQWNGISKRSALKTGQNLVILQPDTVVTSTDGTRTVTYKVRKGDSLARIAQRFSVSVADIEKWNKINSSNYLQPGQQLKLVVDPTQV